jgi:hypothetical protein
MLSSKISSEHHMARSHKSDKTLVAGRHIRVCILVRGGVQLRSVFTGQTRGIEELSGLDAALCLCGCRAGYQIWELHARIIPGVKNGFFMFTQISGA